MRPVKRKRAILLSGIIAILLVVASVSYFVIYKNWNVPLGPGLELPSPTPGNPTVSTLAPQMDLQTEPPPTEIAIAESPTPPEPLCGGPEEMLVLAVGADSTDYLYGLADVIRIVRVDFVTPKVSMLSLPRDLWVEIPEIAEHQGITHGKLNQAYFYGSPGMGYYDGPAAGPGLLARTLDLNFGLRVDHYGAVNMATFIDIIDAVGGIDIYLSEPVDGRPVDENTEDMGYFPAGQHHFNGDQALRFSRIRKQDTVFHRMDRQTQVLCALKDQILTPAVIIDLPEIIAAFHGRVLTDLSLAQLSQLACLGPKINGNNLLSASVPRDMLTSSISETGTFIWDVDNEELRSLIASFVDGSWPSETDEPTCP